MDYRGFNFKDLQGDFPALFVVFPDAPRLLTLGNKV